MLQFLAVDGDGVAGLPMAFHSDPCAAQQVFHQHQGIGQRGVHVDRIDITGIVVRARVLQQLRDDQSHAVNLLVHQFQLGGHRVRLRAKCLAHQVQVALHDGNRVVDFMRDTGRELADGREFF